ncbi:hypothetical protein BD779DRAFT_1710544 [Infundibulicybe gibba]|nr:hypothetical protein BD779DRAFT_1710544 [Infundibulicybe gibba]
MSALVWQKPWCWRGVQVHSLYEAADKISMLGAPPLFPTLAYQLTLVFPGMDEHLWAVIHADPMIFERSLSVQVKKFIAKPFLKLAKTPRSASAVVIIDGLDECDGEPIQGEIVRLWTGSMPFWKIRANSPALLLPRVSSLTQLRSRN